MKSKMLQRRAKQTKVAMTDETINQALMVADQMISDLPSDDARADAIAEIGDRLRAGTSPDMEADVQQLAQFRRTIRGQVPTGNEQEDAAFVEGSGSDNFVMNNEHPDSVEQHIVEGSDQGSNGFVTDRDENGKPKTPETLEVPRIATADVKKEAGMKSKLAAPPAPAAPAPAADANIFNAWTSDCLAAAIKAVTSTAEYASDKAAQQGVGMMNDALKNRPAMPEQPGMATASKKKGNQGFQSYNEMTGVIEEGDKSIPSSHKEQELQGLDKSGKFPRPETVLPEKFAGEQGVKKLMNSLVLAGTE